LAAAAAWYPGDVSEPPATTSAPIVVAENVVDWKGQDVMDLDGEKLGKLEFVNLTNDFFAFEDTLRNGAFVSIGDVNGDGLGDLIAGAGPGGGPRVKIYDGRSLLSVGGDNATVIANFFAGNVNNRGGVKVAAKNLDGDKFIDVVTGGGKGDRAVATAYRGSDLVANSPAPLYEFDLDGTLNGVFVG
jgi:hypothetical protein